jgi:hypothetical protein
MNWNESFARRKNSKFVSFSGATLIGSLFSGASIRYHVVLMSLWVEHIAPVGRNVPSRLSGSLNFPVPSGIEYMETSSGLDVKEEKPS